MPTVRRTEHLARPERSRAQPAELVAGQAGEDLGPAQTAGHAQIRPQPAAQPADLEQLPRSQGHHLASRHRRTVDTDFGLAADHGDVARGEAAQSGRRRR